MNTPYEIRKLELQDQVGDAARALVEFTRCDGFAMTTGDPASPYFLVFGKREEIIAFLTNSLEGVEEM